MAQYEFHILTGIYVKPDSPYLKDSAVLILWDISVQEMEILYKCVCLCDWHANV